jgi:hypothetical protein
MSMNTKTPFLECGYEDRRTKETAFLLLLSILTIVIAHRTVFDSDWLASRF